MDMNAFKAELAKAVAFYEGREPTLPIRVANTLTKPMEKIADQTKQLTRSFDAHSAPIAFPDWKVLPPCF